jgi:UDP-glucose 4-epimerase
MGLRFFNVYGPRQDPASPYSGVISIFCDRIAAGQPITIHGDGEQTRDFIHVSDVVAALLAGMRAASVGAPVCNVCTGQATSVVDLARMIGDLTQKKPTIVHGAPRPGEIRHSLGDPSTMRRVLGLGQTVPLREGLAALLKYRDA